jgi:hypothetical protein
MIERDKEYYNQIISKLYSNIENQEKIIRDLQERNKQLKEDYNTLVSDNCYVLELERKIDKAIEYMDKTDFLEKGYICFMYELEYILKGGNNEK